MSFLTAISYSAVDISLKMIPSLGLLVFPLPVPHTMVDFLFSLSSQAGIAGYVSDRHI